MVKARSKIIISTLVLALLLALGFYFKASDQESPTTDSPDSPAKLASLEEDGPKDSTADERAERREKRRQRLADEAKLAAEEAASPEAEKASDDDVITIRGRIEFQIDGKPEPSLLSMVDHFWWHSTQDTTPEFYESGKFEFYASREYVKAKKVKISLRFHGSGLGWWQSKKITLPSALTLIHDIGTIVVPLGEIEVEEKWVFVRGRLRHPETERIYAERLGFSLFARHAESQKDNANELAYIDKEGVFWTTLNVGTSDESAVMQTFFAHREDFEDGRKPLGRVGNAYDLGDFDSESRLVSASIQITLPPSLAWPDEEGGVHQLSMGSLYLLRPSVHVKGIAISSFYYNDRGNLRYEKRGLWRWSALLPKGSFIVSVTVIPRPFLALEDSDSFNLQRTGARSLRHPLRVSAGIPQELQFSYAFKGIAHIDVRNAKGEVITEFHSRFLNNYADRESPWPGWSIHLPWFGNPYQLKAEWRDFPYLQVASADFEAKTISLSASAQTYRIVLDQARESEITFGGKVAKATVVEQDSGDEKGYGKRVYLDEKGESYCKVYLKGEELAIDWYYFQEDGSGSTEAGETLALRQGAWFRVTGDYRGLRLYDSAWFQIPNQEVLELDLSTPPLPALGRVRVTFPKRVADLIARSDSQYPKFVNSPLKVYPPQTLFGRGVVHDESRGYMFGNLRVYDGYLELGNVPIVDGAVEIDFAIDGKSFLTPIIEINATDFQEFKGELRAQKSISKLIEIAQPDWPKRLEGQEHLLPAYDYWPQVVVKVYEGGVLVPLHLPMLAGHVYRVDVFLRGDDYDAKPRAMLTYRDGWQDDALDLLQPVINEDLKRRAAAKD